MHQLLPLTLILFGTKSAPLIYLVQPGDFGNESVQRWLILNYNTIAFPIPAGLFYPTLGLILRPEIAALSMSGSSLLVAVNALMLKYTNLEGIKARN